MANSLIEVTDLHVTYKTGGDDVLAVRGFDLTVEAGQATGIVGESGSGKSTVARAIVGLVAPTSGSIRIAGDLVAGKDATGYVRANRWRVQMIFQDPYGSLDPRQQPLDAVLEAVAQWRKLSKQAARQEALDLLKSVGITERQATSGIRALSGGQRQRISIARALAPQPQVLVADEPTSSLDESAQAGILNLLRRIQAERGLSVIFISHDLGLVRYLTETVQVMKDGFVVEAGLTDQVLSKPTHEYTQRLTASSLA
jgi:ABC-type dipeptide/oligopeptide/nickel transport system ATPase subunit